MQNPFKARSFRLLMLLVAMLAFSACSTPFSSNIGRFNETPPQQPAAITISDPQVFARETLINDRLREHKFLNNLLNESEQKEFRESISTPALIRDVETIEAFRAAAELSFDPAKAVEARAKKRLDDLQNQIDLTDKETELATAKKNLEKAKAGGEETKQDASNTTNVTTNVQQTPPAKLDQPGGSTPGNTGATQTGQNKTDTQLYQPTPTTDPILGALKTRVTELASRLDNMAKEFGKRKVTVPIPDAERTRDAYRAELRQRLNAINLDDLHDYGGNALYRLQFRATVMPGEYKDKFGIARLTFDRASLEDEEIDELYRTWLNHLALRLNQPLPVNRKECPKPIAGLLRLEQAGLFDLHEMKTKSLINDLAEEEKTSVKENCAIEECTIYVPIPTGLLKTSDKKFNELIDQLYPWADPVKTASIVKNVIPILEIIRDANRENCSVERAVKSAIDKIRKMAKKRLTGLRKLLR